MAFSDARKKQVRFLFGNTAKIVIARIREQPDLKTDTFYPSIVFSGSMAAFNAVFEIKRLGQLWVQDSYEKAEALTRLCALSMLICRCGETREKKVAGIPRDALAARLLSFFNDNSEDSREYFRNMYRQYVHDNNARNNYVVYHTLVIARLSEELGRGIVDWNELIFPVISRKKIAEALRAGAMLPSPADIEKMEWSFRAGAFAEMTFTTLYQKLVSMAG